MKGMKGWRSGLRRPQMSTLLLLYVGLLCQLRGTFSIGHQHGNPIEVGQQLIQDSSPTPSKLPTPSPPTFDTPTPFPTASPPVQASSGIFPFMAPPPLEIPVITNPSTPELSGFCPFDFSTLEGTLIRTAGDCPAPLALYVGSVICCPQLESLFQVSLGQYSLDSGNLGLNVTEAEYCFSDTQNLMASLGANTSLGDLCAAQPANLTSGLCPVTKVSQLEEMINTTKLLDACHSVDPLKECTEEPTCQSQVMDVATQMAGQLVGDPGQLNGSAVPPGEQQVVVDCKNMVLAWLASKLGPDAANTMLRNLISCRVNKECPLEFRDPMPVAKACGCSSTPSIATCCRAIDGYLLEVQQQMLITNLQALRCVTFLASMLQNMSVFADIYSLCGIDLKDFSLQGCLLSSLPSDIMSNVTGIDFTCDLNDNIAAPWVQTLKTDAAYSVCGRPPVALPAIPESSTASWSIDFRRRNFLIMALCVVFIISKL
uniref:SPARK domain-containing protein n=1 Tax=Physcomitrium patens TaxID=3218 RepID=A0A7I4AG73_PHYPA